MERMKPIAIVVLAALVLSLCLPGCSSDASPPPPADEIEVVPFKSTLQLTKDDLASVHPDQGDGILVFDNAPAALANVARTNVIVGAVSPSTPMGLMRIVKSVKRDGSSLTLETLNAPIQIAYSRVHMKIQPRSTGPLGALKGSPNDVSPRAIRPLGGGIVGPSQSIDGALDFDIMLFDGDGDPTTTDDQVEMKATLAGTIKVGFTLDFDWGFAGDALTDAAVSCLESILLGPVGCLLALIPEAKVTLGADAHLDAKATITGAAIADFSKTFDILDVPLDPIMLYPVPIIPVVTLTAGIEGGASAGFSAGVHASVNVTSGVVISSKHLDTPGYTGPTLSTPTVGADTPAVTLEAHIKASIGAQASILIAGVAGPYAAANIFADLRADLTKAPCWELDAGIDSALGVTVKPTLPIVGSVTLFDWHATPFTQSWKAKDGACDIPPNTSSVPPGSGADGAHYANPTFTPWARLASTPASGSPAGTPTGDGTDFTNLERTIDGRYFVTGSRVTAPFKVDAKKASVTWARRYHDGDANGPVLTTNRSMQMLDSSLRVLTSGADVASFGLLDIGQAGGVYGHRVLTLSDAGCAPSPNGLASDGSGGAYVAGTCNDRKRGFVVHVAADGSVMFAITLADAASAVVPTLLLGVAGDAFIGGVLHPSSGNDAMFALRLDPSGKTKVSQSYAGCAAAPDVAPTAGIVNTNGDVTLVGSSSANHVGFLGRLRADGSVAFASFPGLGLGLSTVFVINSVAELPTTGYVVGGSTVDVTGSGVTTTAAAALVGLDAIGHTLWSKRYTLLESGAPVASGFPGIRLSDDGGVVVVAIADDAAGGTGGRIFALEAVAKDGSLAGIDTARAQVDGLGITDVQCALSASAWTAKLAPLATTASSRAVSVEPVTLGVANVTH